MSYRFTPRYYEIDGQGVMFFMWYLGHVDEAVDAFFADRGLPHSTWPSNGFDAHAVHVDVDFSSGVRRHDTIEVLLRPSRIGGKSFTLGFEFHRDGELVCRGSVVYATVSTEGHGTIALPDVLVKALGDVRQRT
ncbi:thioesterase family protein [Lentzea sp. NPDC051838]|uniref:acyl-CoA thioesterase n=1 Tax=Lentzea sp. NPDC051838 TaxID=3154849 RepID=UPI00341E8EAE